MGSYNGGASGGGGGVATVAAGDATIGIGGSAANPTVRVAALTKALVTATGLTAADVNALATALAGAAGGVATLDGTTKIPAAQIPALSYVPLSAEGAANGVATLDGTTNIPAAQLGAALLAAARGAANGVASLDGTSKVPVAQVPSVPAALSFLTGKLGSDQAISAAANIFTTAALASGTWLIVAMLNATNAGAGVQACSLQFARASGTGAFDANTTTAYQTLLPASMGGIAYPITGAAIYVAGGGGTDTINIVANPGGAITILGGRTTFVAVKIA